MQGQQRLVVPSTGFRVGLRVGFRVGLRARCKVSKDM